MRNRTLGTYLLCAAAFAGIMLLVGGAAVCTVNWLSPEPVAAVEAPVCNMDVTVIGYGELCADGMAQSPSPSTHVCFTVEDEVVCVPLDRTVVRRSL